jgi:thiosulfate reductase cytochrome b subunit
MVGSATLREAALREPETAEGAPRHSAVVRVTHWLVTFSFFGLLVSGIAILLAHPRLYWGETGGFGVPSLLDLPIPFRLGHSGWGRSLHFLCAWICILTGMVYVVSSFLSGHFSNHLMPRRGDLSPSTIGRGLRAQLSWTLPGDEGLLSYNSLQRLVYLVVIFLLFPVTVLSGLAMSPAITSVLPQLVEGFGGQQSSRTIHFFAACLLLVFAIVHVAMVLRKGFVQRMRGMITGHIAGAEMQR